MILLFSPNNLPRNVLRVYPKLFDVRISQVSFKTATHMKRELFSSCQSWKTNHITSYQRLFKYRTSFAWGRVFKSSNASYSDLKIVNAQEFPKSVSEKDVGLKKIKKTDLEDGVVVDIETDRTLAENSHIFKIKIFDEALEAKSEKKIPLPFITSVRKEDKSPIRQNTIHPHFMPSEHSLSASLCSVTATDKTTQAATTETPPSVVTKNGSRTETRVKMSRMRLRIAERLKYAQDINVMLTTVSEIDISSIISFRRANMEAFQKKYGIKLGFMSTFLKAAAYALQDQPIVNAVIEENEIIYRDYIDISVAIATPKGLVVPVVRNVEKMNFPEIELEIKALTDKARKNTLSLEEMKGGTFTITNGGVFGSLLSTPIINPPQSAILGMHSSLERPVAINGRVVIRPMMYVALTYDHRIIDGREAIHFLKKVKEAVEDSRTIFAGL